MNKEKIKLFSIIIMLLCISPSIVYADMMWPPLYIAEGTRCWYVILIGFIIEVLFVKFFIDKTKWTKAILISFVMNLVSSLCGVALIQKSFLGVYVLLFDHTFSVLQLALDLVLAAVINVLIEGLVIKIIFKINFKKNFWFLFMANLVSIAFALIPHYTTLALLCRDWSYVYQFRYLF